MRVNSAASSASMSALIATSSGEQEKERRAVRKERSLRAVQDWITSSLPPPPHSFSRKPGSSKLWSDWQRLKKILRRVNNYCTVIVLVRVLFALFGSGMKLQTVLAWLICVPGGTDELTLTVSEKVAHAPTGRS